MQSAIWLHADRGVQRHPYGTDTCGFQKLARDWFLLPYPAPHQWRNASRVAYQNGLWLNSWLDLGQAVCNSQFGQVTSSWWRTERLVYQGIQTTAKSVQYVAMTGDVGTLHLIPPVARTDIAIVSILPRLTWRGSLTAGTYEAAQRLAHWALFIEHEVMRVQGNCPQPGDYPKPRHILHADSVSEQAMVLGALDPDEKRGDSIDASRRPAGRAALVDHLRQPRRGQRIVFLVADPADHKYVEWLRLRLRRDLGLDVVHISVCSKFDQRLALDRRVGRLGSRSHPMEDRIDEAYPPVR